MHKPQEKKYTYWREIMAQHAASSQSQEAFCKAHHLSFRKFKYYRYRIQVEEKGAQEKKPAFIPVTVTELAEPAQTQSTTSCLVLLPSGVELRLPASQLDKPTARFIKELL